MRPVALLAFGFALAAVNAQSTEPATIAELERFATRLRIDCTKMLTASNSGHLDSSLSCADIVAALYMRVMRHDASNPSWPERDRFILSKGHAAPIQYAALAECGYYPVDDLVTLRQLDSHLQGHPDMLRTPGVEVSTGSLGQGLSMGVGMGLAMRLDRLPGRIYVVMSDGDCQEGQTWEAATAAPHFDLPNITAIVDYNHLQTDGTTEEVMDVGRLNDKFAAFDWETHTIDGHSMTQIVDVLELTRDVGHPVAIVANTRKGRGVSFMENTFGFHGKAAGTPEQAAAALAELEATLAHQNAKLNEAQG